jgi:lysophospholipase L1-like esterase
MFLLGTAVAASCLFLTACSVFAGKDSILPDNGTLVVAGDSITFHSVTLPFGYYHQMTNAFAAVCPGKNVKIAPLGFSGSTVGSWIDLEKRTRDGKPYMTHAKNPGWNVTEVLAGKVDVVAIFLGMNDILMPSVRDNDGSLDRWAEKLRTFVNALRERTGAKRFVLCTITPLTADRKSPKNLVRERMAERLRKFAAEEGHRVAEFGDAVMKTIDDCRKFSSSYQPVPDFVHPQELGHIAMAAELCRALGEEKCADYIDGKYKARLELEKSRSKDPIAWRLDPLSRKFVSPECQYRIDWNWHDTPEFTAPEKGVKMEARLPEGWKTVEKDDEGMSGYFVVSGKPERFVNEVKLEAKLSGSVASSVVPIAAPWMVSEPWDFAEVWRGQTWKTNAPAKKAEKEVFRKPWHLVTPTHDYTGYIGAGSLEPWQVFFGWSHDSIWACRNIVSGKEREVKAVFSHQTFSATLGFTVFANGEKVFAGTMDRRGKNRTETVFKLKKGFNSILVRIDHANWQRQFKMVLEPVGADNLDDLRYVCQDVCYNE